MSSFIIHFISIKDGAVSVSLVGVGAQLSKHSVPVTENLSHSLALQSLLEILSACAFFFQGHPFQINVGNMEYTIFIKKGRVGGVVANIYLKWVLLKKEGTSRENL